MAGLKIREIPKGGRGMEVNGADAADMGSKAGKLMAQEET